MARRDFPKCHGFVEATLTLLGAEEYFSNFKKNGIDVSLLSALTEEDLEHLGIKNAELQKKFIDRCKNLPSAAEFDYQADDEFFLCVVKNIEKHLTVIHAWLSCIMLHDNIDNSHVKLTNAIRMLKAETDHLSTDLEILNSKLSPLPTKPKSKWKYVVAIVITSSLSAYLIKKFLVH